MTNEVKLSQDGHTRFHRRGMWQLLYKVSNCLCQDGSRRTIHVTGQPDTFYSIPGRAVVKRKTVSGFLTTQDEQWIFIATGANACLLNPEVACSE